MTNERFFDRERLPKKKIKDKKEKSTYFHSYQSQKRLYDLGGFLSDVGNQEIQSFFESGLVQAKLNVNQSGDIYEQEADRIAKDIVNSNTKQPPKVNNIKKRPAAKNKSVNTNLESKIKGLKGKGNPLNKSIKEYFEPRFGVDLGNVRIHTGGNDLNKLARLINAKAFTFGNDIVFGEGEYNPATTEGKKLMAHELTHTIQQDGGMSDVVQREERVFDYSTQSFYIKYSPEEYAERVINVMNEILLKDKYMPTTTNLNLAAALEGWKIIGELPTDTLFETLKIIYEKNPGFISILRLWHGVMPIKIIELYKQSIIEACIKAIEYNDYSALEIVKFREEAVKETINMLSETEVAINKEITEYTTNDSKLTLLADIIKYTYGKRYDDADQLRAKELIKFCENENVKSILDVLQSTIIFQNMMNILSMAVYCKNETNLANELRYFDNNIVFDVMAGFVYMYKKDKIQNSPANYNSSSAMYNDSARNYILTNYPGVLKAEYDDIVTTYLLHNEEANQFRFLTDIHTDFRTLAQKTVSEIKKDIIDILNKRKENAIETREKISGDHELIWELKPLISLLMEKKGISKESEQGKLIVGCVQTRDQFKTFRSIALGILGLALGIAGFFTAGTSWAALPILGGIAVSTLDLIIEVNDYTFQSAASKSMYDFALTVEPSALGIAFAILGLALDAVDLVKYSSKLVKEAAEVIAKKSAEGISGELIEQYNILKNANKINVEFDKFAEAVLKTGSPLGFKNIKHFNQAMSELDLILKNLDAKDFRFGVSGSSVSGVSYKTGKSFSAASDIDVFVESNILTEGLSTSKNIPGFVHPNKLMSVYPELNNWCKRWSNILGREVSIGGFRKGSLPIRPTIFYGE